MVGNGRGVWEGEDKQLAVAVTEEEDLEGGFKGRAGLLKKGRLGK